MSEKGAKKGPKWEPKSDQNPKKAEKRGSKNRCEKRGEKQRRPEPRINPPGAARGRFSAAGGTGVSGFDPASGLKTPCTRRGAADFLFKNRPWEPQDRLILPFLSIFKDSKNRCFFDGGLGRQKIEEIWPRVAKRSLCRERPATLASWGPQGGHARDQKSRKRPVGKRQKGQRERRQVEKWKKWKGGKGKKEKRKERGI